MQMFCGHKQSSVRVTWTSLCSIDFLQINGDFDPHKDDADEIGDPESLSIVLGENVRHLRYLDIRSSLCRKGVRLDFAAPLQLVSLQVLAEGRLSVNISDVGTLAAALQVLHLQGSKPMNKIARLRPLLKAMWGMGKRYTYITIPQKHERRPFHGVRWIAGVQQDRRTQAINGHFACCCGACWGCLQRAGALDRLLST